MFFGYLFMRPGWVYIERLPVGSIPVGMDSYLTRVDLDNLLREISCSLDYEWGFHRVFHPRGLAASIYRIKGEYRQRLAEVLPKTHQVYEELKFNCTLAYQKQVVPALPADTFGRFLASCCLIVKLLEFWENHPGPKPSRKERLQLLVVPFWLRLCNEKMQQEERKVTQMRHFRWGIYKQMGMMSSSMRGMKDKELDTHWGSETTLVAPQQEEEIQAELERRQSEDSQTSGALDSTMKVEGLERECESGLGTGQDLGCQGQRQLKTLWSLETEV
ncbi:ORF2 [Gould's wattled bat adenovirus 1]|nr:ORF2 [Mastadenovirus sp.]